MRVVLIIAGPALLAFLSMWLGLVPRPYASTVIKIKSGRPYLRKGQLRSYAREQIAEILLEAGVSNGFIAITPQNGVACSRQIPSAVRQRLRNVLLNQSS